MLPQAAVYCSKGKAMAKRKESKTRDIQNSEVTEQQVSETEMMESTENKELSDIPEEETAEANIPQDLSSIITFALNKIRNYMVKGCYKSLSSTAMRAVEIYPLQGDGHNLEWMDTSEQVRQWIEAPAPSCFGLAELYSRFSLSPEDIEIIAALAGLSLDLNLFEIYADLGLYAPHKELCIGDICRFLGCNQTDAFERYLERFAKDAPLVRQALVLVPNAAAPDRILKGRACQRLQLADRVIDFLKAPGTTNIGEKPLQVFEPAISEFAYRNHERVALNSLYLSKNCENALLQLVRSRSFPAILSAPVDTGKERVASAIANLLGRNLLVADLTCLLSLPRQILHQRLAEVFREARLGNDFIYFHAEGLPETLPKLVYNILKNGLSNESFTIGTDHLPHWLVRLSVGWPVVPIPLPAMDQRILLWQKAFENDKRKPADDAIAAIARRFEISERQIAQAAQEARRLSMIARRKRPDINDLDHACRAFFTHQLTDFANLVPPATFKPEDLILPEAERIKFDEVMLYATEHDTIYDEWGFAERFPYGRGLSMLFYGPPGTGKTMAASIIANHLGLDLFRVDLSRIMNSYVGETEKNLAHVFDEAERGRVMLLFDEADALFTKRSTVKANVDRYANLEVAYLLQRMENFDGVTVLTTNAEINLDDAFRRRLKYKIYFPMPDADTRSRLYETLIPKGAPVLPDIPYALLGEHFELSGGQIKQAVLRAAFYARRDGKDIGLTQLTEASLTECRELGMLVNDSFPMPLTNALRVEKGLSPLTDEEYKALRKPMLRMEEEELLAKQASTRM